MSFLVEPVVSELFNGLFEILGLKDVRDFARQLVGGVDSELENLKTKLEMIQQVLYDAEAKQLSERAVKRWLDDLQDWAYDAVDILDEFAYEALRRKLKPKHQTRSSNVFSYLPASLTSPLFGVRMGSQIKDISSSLEKLRNQRIQLGLQVTLGGTSSTPTAHKRPDLSSSVQPEKFVYGRDEDEAKLVDMVKTHQQTGANFRVISIVGMGGIGKTTIARKIYNHLQEMEDLKFEKKAWVCVSDNFDVLTISKALLQSIDSTSFIPNNLNEVQIKLRETVTQKKFLLVLDDVWNDIYAEWEILMSPFMNGAAGSTAIVTTRLENVASAIRSHFTHRLKPVSNDHCWQLFQEHAFENGTAGDAQRITDSIRKRVIERCGGLPLAAKTLGSLLRSQRIDAWQNILNSKVWNTSTESDVLPALRLSYHHLPCHLKRCFGYCGLFPKDYEFEKKELAFLWMAECIAQPSYKQLDMALAGQYFDDLCSSSFFEKSSDNCRKYVMHDLIHDLAQSVFKEIGFRSEQAIVKLPEKFERLRHFAYIPYEYDSRNKFIELEKVKGLRTFLPVFMRPDYAPSSDCYITAMVVFDLLPKFKKLRVLSLERYYITHLHDSIGGLIHLRYLNFSYTMIRSLPESTSSLYNLQTLLLKDCYCLMKLPSNLRYLTNLCYFDISGQNLLKKMSYGMKELKNLQILTNFIVGKGMDSNLNDLMYLSILRELHITVLENVTDPKQIRGQILSNKNHLKALLLEWGDQVLNDSRKHDVEMHTLEKLRPPSNLEELTIKGYGGENFPSWFGDSQSLSNVVVLRLENCNKCTSLPSLEMLSSLEDLTIKDMKSLRRICFTMPLKSLKVLRFENLQEWENWDTWKGNEDVKGVAQLLKLSIIKCPQLRRNFPNHLPSLMKLVIRECAKLVVSLSSLPMFCKLEFDGCHGQVRNNNMIDFKSLNSWSLSNIPEIEVKLKQGSQTVEFLDIVECPEIIDSWQSLAYVEKPLQGLHGLTFLSKLSIENCTRDLVFLENTNFLPNLSSLEIRKCQALKSLPEGLKQKNLERLVITECDSLTFIESGTLPSSLRRLEVRFCKKLEFLKDLGSSFVEYLSIHSCNFLIFTSSESQLPETLKELEISGCHKLKTLSSRSLYLPKALSSLSIQFCSGLKSIVESFDNSKSLRKINLRYCENLESLPSGLHYIPCLENIWLHGCPKLLVGEEVPTSLIELSLVGDMKFEKPMIEWDLQNLRRVYIYQCEDAVSILQEDKGMLMLSSLISLSIGDCLKLEHLSSLIFQSLISLEDFTIYNVPELKSLPDLCSLTSLTKFTFERCPRLESIHNLSSLTSLRCLFISECPKIQSIPALCSVEDLTISKCPNLKSLKRLPSSLVSLRIGDCPLLKKQWKRSHRKYWSKIAHVPKVKIDYKFIFNSKEAESA
ncbi:putative disease resistance RPP13-like protein 1 [Mangifera indica]|uniref:putative disease resistance RPP13-like protein 1 n=1 Tax=Mangifera indica TaxID=29780 RepID=UPI001CFA4E27|nr:putative disease resistance RPP13-like protein 1 [Mangifera indica]XP_044478676.1 putative disease resistance RPP13-like protein 1 [Mangifera indica]XP_044478677.1 putative disease resistance RPP13-like protein 1 [Mangifera indica]